MLANSVVLMWVALCPGSRRDYLLQHVWHLNHSVLASLKGEALARGCYLLFRCWLLLHTLAHSELFTGGKPFRVLET